MCIACRKARALGLSLTLLLASSARGDDLIRIHVPSQSLSVSSNDFTDLAKDLVRQEGAFSGLVGVPAYDADMTYLGIPNALRLQVTNFGQNATLQIPSTGHSQSFTATSPADLQNQLEDYLKKTGANQWAKFLEQSNARSPLALVDGNPRSATALLAGSAFRRFGIDSSRARIGYQSEEVADWGGFQLRAEGAFGDIDLDDFGDLASWDGALTLAGNGPRVGVAFSILGQYLDYQGADSYDAGLELGLPILLRRPGSGDPLPLSWQLTPFVQSGAGVSLDLAAGGLFMGGGAVSSLALQLGPVELTLADELVYYGGIPIDDIDGYDFDTRLDQLVTRNGLKLGFHPLDLVFVDAGLSLTDFLTSDAAVDDYASPFAGVGVLLGGIAELRVGYEADLGISGQDYTAHSVRATLDFQF